MAKSTLEALRVSPISLVCPYCKAERGKDCATLSDGLAIVHVERIKMAEAIDAARHPDRK
jgi:hypothetical protein